MLAWLIGSGWLVGLDSLVGLDGLDWSGRLVGVGMAGLGRNKLDSEPLGDMTGQTEPECL